MYVAGRRQHCAACVFDSLSPPSDTKGPEPLAQRRCLWGKHANKGTGEAYRSTPVKLGLLHVNDHGGADHAVYGLWQAVHGHGLGVRCVVQTRFTTSRARGTSTPGRVAEQYTALLCNGEETSEANQQFMTVTGDGR